MDKIELLDFGTKMVAKFWMKVKIVSSKSSFNLRFGQCWEWQGPYFKSGYGHFQTHKNSYRSHRIAYYLHNGRISKDKFIYHKCDNFKCVNPDHLLEGEKKMPTKKRKKRISSKSIYHGVYFKRERLTKKWRAQIYHNYKFIQVGYFNCEDEAAVAYNEKLKQLGIHKAMNEV